MMKILIINTYDIQGGAAITAYRLAKGLKKYHDVECNFLVGLKRSSDPNVFWTRKNKRQHYIESALDMITNSIGLQYQFFPFSKKTILQKAKELKPDLIYLRNLHGGYFETSLISKLSRLAPIAWTLSDMWSFTGNCAHTFGDDSWKEMRGCKDKSIYPAIGINTGSWLLSQKRKIYQKSSNISIITPSKWLYNLARQSPVFEGKDIVQIYNGFDLSVFRKKDKRACRKALDIPTDSRVLMFGADSLANNPWKGGKDLLDILQEINARIEDKLHLLVVGFGNLEGLSKLGNLIIHQVGNIQNDILMATCYSAADILIYPTKADNLPNILIEAISCGTPCVTFDIGGCGEIIIDGFCGRIIEPFNKTDFADKTVEILQDSDCLEKISNNARNIAVQNFSLEKMSANYFNLFSKITGGTGVKSLIMTKSM